MKPNISMASVYRSNVLSISNLIQVESNNEIHDRHLVLHENCLLSVSYFTLVFMHLCWYFIRRKHDESDGR